MQDQRSYDGRPDVMTYQTAPLTQAMRVSGPPIADLFAKTTGTDGDFVVKVIDVYPDQYADEPKKGGYQPRSASTSSVAATATASSIPRRFPPTRCSAIASACRR